ncbi:MAG: aminotransferase class IV [Cyanobacteria bacterium J06598_3]
MAFWYDGDLFDDGSVEEGGSRFSQAPNDSAGWASRPSVPLDNAGLRFGATVFTTLRIYGGDLNHPFTQWQGHCDRLKQSFQKFGWFSPNWSAIQQGCQQLQLQYPILRVTLFPDGREWITGRELPSQLASQQQQGVACWVAPADYARSLPTHKTGNYLACWLARQQAEKQGAHEAILTNQQGDWLETSTGNLWGWAHGKWWTPRGNQCLPGIMQARLQRLLSAAGQPVSCPVWSNLQLGDFEAIAYSNCAVELVPIHTILKGATKLEYDPQHASIKALQEKIRH